MVAKNDITGDSIQSRPSSTYESNYDSIFRKEPVSSDEPKQLELDLGEPNVTSNQPTKLTKQLPKGKN
jgi:hypothetical protein